jgi:hypothetical protein
MLTQNKVNRVAYKKTNKKKFVNSTIRKICSSKYIYVGFQKNKDTFFLFIFCNKTII